MQCYRVHVMFTEITVISTGPSTEVCDHVDESVLEPSLVPSEHLGLEVIVCACAQERHYITYLPLER